MKNSKKAKEIWIRKTYGQEVTLREQDISILAQVNSSLVELWNTAIKQCDAWLAMPKGTPGKNSITPISLNFWLTGARETSPALKAVSVVIEREMLRRLVGGYSSYFALLKKKDDRARPPSKKDYERYFIALTWTEKSFSVEGDRLSASIGSKRRVEFVLGDYIKKELESLPKGSKIAQVTISRRNGEYWANFVCNIPRPESVIPKEVIAIDLGSGDIACCCSNGKEFSFPARRPDKKWRKEIIAVEVRLGNCKKGSRSWKRRTKARRIMHRKALNQHTDHQRKLANWLAQQKMVIVVGKMRTRLGLSKSEGTPEQHWGVQNTGYAFRLLIFLREKAAEYGLTILEFPDPSRKGSTENPDAKFEAARELLRKGCEQLSIHFPNQFNRFDFSFPQG